MIKRFTFDDPDQNGKDDTYGMGCAGLHPDPMVSHFYYVFGAFGVEPSQWQEIDGTVQYSNVTEGYKEADVYKRQPPPIKIMVEALMNRKRKSTALPLKTARETGGMKQGNK